MSTITNINGTDLITDSRANINDNFNNLNTDKMETSVLDTDTTLAANSDAKVATQKAVKAYVDAGGNVNATETTKGIVEVATQAEVDAGTDTGATGASLVVTPATLVGIAAPVVQVYETGDSPATWTKPSGLKYVVVEVQAGGGAGGQGGSSSNGGSGGSGGYSRKLISASALSATETVTVGGIAGNSSFGAHTTTVGGGSASTGTAGTAGTASGGDINIAGLAGQAGKSNDNSGSSSEYRAPGATPSFFGSGGYGAGGQGETQTSADEGTGVAGIVIVTEYYV